MKYSFENISENMKLVNNNSRFLVERIVRKTRYRIPLIYSLFPIVYFRLKYSFLVT